MKSVLLLVLVFSISTVIYSQPDWKEMGLKGKVRSLKIQDTYRYKKSGTWTPWEKTYTRSYLFDDTGRKTEFAESRIYDSSGYKVVYTYKPKENKAELTYHDKNGLPTSKTHWLYNEKGQRTEEIQYSKEGAINWRYTYSFDAKGNRINMIGYKTNGAISSKYNWTYNDRNKMDSLLLETPGYANSSQKYKYDDKGNLIEETWYDGKGAVNFRFIRTYDAYNNLIQEIKYKGNSPTPNDKVFWKYEYDKNGNWTKKTKLAEDGTEYSIEERTIAYY